MLKRLLSAFLCVSMFCGSSGVVTAAQAAEVLPEGIDALPFVFEETDYGVDKEGVLAHALRVTDEDTSIEAVESGGGMVILRKALEGDTDTLYLVGQYGLVKSFEAADTDSDWKAVDDYWGSKDQWAGIPAVSLIGVNKSYDGVCYDSLYTVKNPQNNTYDIYNPVTGIYYEYGLEASPDGIYGTAVYRVKKDGMYGIMDAKGKMVYEPQYDSIDTMDSLPVLYAVKDDKFGFLDFKGILDGECRYTELSDGNGHSQVSGSRILCRKESGYCVFDVETGEEIEVPGHSFCALGRGCFGCSFYDEQAQENQVVLLTEKGELVNVNERFGGTSSEMMGESDCGICQVAVYTEGESGHTRLFLDSNGERLFERELDEAWLIDSRDVEYSDYTEGYAFRQTRSLSDENLFECALVDEKGKVLKELGLCVDKRAEIEGVIDGCVLMGIYSENESEALVYDTESGELVLNERNAYFYETNQELTTNGGHLILLQRNGENLTEDDGYQALFNTFDKAFSGWDMLKRLFDDEIGRSEMEYFRESIIGEKMTLWIGEALYNGQFTELKQMGESAEFVTERGNYAACGYNDEKASFVYRVYDSNGALLKEYLVDDSEVPEYSDRGQWFLAVRTEADGLWGYCDADGVLKVEPQFYNAQHISYYGLAYVSADGGREGIIDRNGNWLVSCSEFRWEESQGKNILIEESYDYDRTLFLYNFSDIVGSFTENTFNRDDLFGAYHSYLKNNQAYKTMHNTLYDAAASLLAARTGMDDNFSAMKTLFKDGPKRALQQILEAITGKAYLEEEIEEETAAALIRLIDSQESALEGIVKGISKELKLSKKTYEILSKISTARTVKEEWAVMEAVQGKLSKEQSKAILEAVQGKWEKIDGIFKTADVLADSLQVAVTVCILANLEMETVDRLLSMLTPGTTIYDGMVRLKGKLRSGWYAPEKLIETFLVDDIFKDIANAVVLQSTSGAADILNLFGSSGSLNLKGALAVASVIYYAVGCVMPVAEYDDVVEAVYSMNLCNALSFGLNNKYLEIAGNYNKTGNTAGEELREAYQFAYEAYEAALNMMASKCSALGEAAGNNAIVKKRKEWLDGCITAYSGKMSYSNFIITCLKNLNKAEAGSFGYRLDTNGNAVIVSLNGETTETKGVEAVKVAEAEKKTVNLRWVPAAEEMPELICIPETIDGHTVVGIDQGAFQGESGIGGIFLPDTVTEIGEQAFKDCTALDVVCVGGGLQNIGNEAFSGCGALKFLKVPAGVTEIGTDAFAGCEEMTLWCRKEDAAWQYAQSNGISAKESDRQTVSIKIADPAAKQSYTSDEEVDTAGLSLEVTWDDGTVTEVKEGFTALFEEKDAEKGRIAVLYGASAVSYEVSIIPQVQTYHICYQDESGEALAAERSIEMLYGSTQLLQAETIEGYTPQQEQMNVTAGDEDTWTFVYTKNKRKDIAECIAFVNNGPFAYTGNEIIPEIIVYDWENAKYLTKGTDYQVLLSDNTEVGEAWVGIRGIGKYEGTTEMTFFIYKKPAPVKVQRIQIKAVSNKIAAGRKVVLKASVLPANAVNKTLIWKSSNTKIATVSKNGVVTMKKGSGGKKVTITAAAADGSGVKATYRITSMKGIVKKITISGKKTVKAEKSLKLKAKVKASGKANKKLQWSSSNEKLAVVSKSGKVTAKKGAKGKKVKITAMATDGSGRKKTVTIKIR